MRDNDRGVIIKSDEKSPKFGDETFTVFLIVRNVRNCKSAQYASFKALTYIHTCILWIIYVCVNNKWNRVVQCRREEVEGRSHFIWWSIDRRYYPTAEDCCRMLGFRKGNNSLWCIEQERIEELAGEYTRRMHVNTHTLLFDRYNHSIMSCKRG